jgi:mannose-6-phosphate isomerase-like protein (cupin superfamily)
VQVNLPANYFITSKNYIVKRRNFLSAGAVGFSFLNFPGFAFAQNNNNGELLQPFDIPPREPLKPGAFNSDVRTIIHAGQTNKQFSNIEGAFAPKQMGPSPHMHENLDELMYVLEGTASVMIGEKVYEVEAGGWNFRPRRIIHSIWNGSDKPLRFVDCFFNQNFEDYLDEFFHKIVPDMEKNNLTPTSPEIAKRLAVLDKQFGVTWFHDQRQAIIDKYKLHG